MPPPDKVLVSASFLGRPVRYDGNAKTLHDSLLDRWTREGRIIPVCPELLADLPTRRPPAEIAHEEGGAAVSRGTASIIEAGGEDVTATYVAGARAALELAVKEGCRVALLTDGSPSCGSSFIYDGSFTGRRHAGEGVAAALLGEHGVQVFSPNQISDIAALLDRDD